MKTKQQLINRVIEVLKEQIEQGDETVIDELFHFIPCKNLVNCLYEEEWKNYEHLVKQYNQYTINHKTMKTIITNKQGLPAVIKAIHKALDELKPVKATIYQFNSEKQRQECRK